MQCLVVSAQETLKEGQLQKRRLVIEEDSNDELQINRLYLPQRV